MSKTFGEYLRAKRTDAGLSLRDLAKRLGVSHVFLGEVERGVKGGIARDRWNDLIKALPGVTIEELAQHAVGDALRKLGLSLEDAMAATNKKKAPAASIDLSNLSAEQLAKLREQLDDLEADKDEKAKPRRDYVYTNVRNADVMIPDLGQKRGRSFDPFVFPALQTVDLKSRFSSRDIRRSYHLRALVEKGLIIEGKATPEQFQQAEDPISSQVRSISKQLGDVQASDSNEVAMPAVVKVEDPLAGQRDADKRLKEVMRNGPGGEREDIATRKR